MESNELGGAIRQVLFETLTEHPKIFDAFHYGIDILLANRDERTLDEVATDIRKAIINTCKGEG